VPGQSFRPGFGYSAATARRYSNWSQSQYSSDVLSIRFPRLVAVSVCMKFENAPASRYAISAEIGAFCVLPQATNAPIAARMLFQ
jgi:hypothetical protein